MARKLTYRELEQRIRELETEGIERKKAEEAEKKHRAKEKEKLPFAW